LLIVKEDNRSLKKEFTMLSRTSPRIDSVPASAINPSIIGQTVVVKRLNPVTGSTTIRMARVESYATRMVEGANHYVLNDSLLMLKIGVDKFTVVGGLESLNGRTASFKPDYQTEQMTLAEAGEDLIGNAVTFHLEGLERTLFVTDINIKDDWVDVFRPGSIERIIRVKNDTLITV
jgi:hypothetical protein